MLYTAIRDQMAHCQQETSRIQYAIDTLRKGGPFGRKTQCILHILLHLKGKSRSFPLADLLLPLFCRLQKTVLLQVPPHGADAEPDVILSGFGMWLILGDSAPSFPPGGLMLSDKHVVSKPEQYRRNYKPVFLIIKSYGLQKLDKF